MSDTHCSSNLLPQHIAVIMDGNGRWAKQRGKLSYLWSSNGGKISARNNLNR